MNVRAWSVIGLLLVSAGAMAEEVEEAEETPERRDRWIRGELSVGADFYWSDRDSDMNLNQTLRLRADPAKYPRVHVKGSVWLQEDLDGDESRTSALRSFDDTYDQNFRARLLYLHLDVDDLWGDSVLRVGRQRILEGLAYNRIDGAYFRQQEGRWDWYAFGGVRASLYSNGNDDPVLGGGVGYRPNARTRVAVDTFYAEEHRLRGDVVYRRPAADLFRLPFPRRVQQNINETVAALSLWHDLTPTLRLYGRYFWKDGNGDEIRLHLSGYQESSDVSYEVALRTQLNAAGDQVADLSNFFRVLGRFEPYYNVFTAVHVPMTQRSLLSLEAEIHNAENDDPFSANRDYQRFAAIVSVDEVLENTDATLALEYWGVDSGEGSFAVTGEIERSWKRVRARLGADFERYKDRYVAYRRLPSLVAELRVAFNPNVFAGFTPLVRFFDTTVVETQENVYSIFAKIDWEYDEQQDFRFGVTWEQDDGPDSPYWRVQADYVLRF